MHSDRDLPDVTYTDNRHIDLALVAGFGTFIPSAIVGVKLGVLWGIVGGCFAVLFAALAFRRAERTAWTVGDFRVEVTSGARRDVYDIRSIRRVSRWEPKGPQEVVFDLLGGVSFGVPIKTDVILLAIGRQLMALNMDPDMDKTTRELLGMR